MVDGASMRMKMASADKEKPACFGVLETVFPMGGDGLRHTPAGCMKCDFKTECLRSAMESRDGLKLHEEKIDRAWSAGRMGFFERWSRRKALERKRRSRY